MPVGPYVDTQNEISQEQTDYHHLFSKGVHLIVNRLTDNERVLTFFASDGRLFFLIPMGPKNLYRHHGYPGAKP